MAIKGVARVRRNLKSTFDEIDSKQTFDAVYGVLSEIGLDATARTPIETSTLVNSMYLPKVYQYKGKTTGFIGYTAEYAGWVHDAPGTLQGLGIERASGKGDYWDPDGEPQFLDKAAEYVEKSLAHRILREAYRVK